MTQVSRRILIVGRPNVGKSTLFNRLIGRKRALVHDLPGVTRDRMEEPTQWWSKGRPYPAVIVDTGGLGGDQFSDEIQKQVNIALKDTDLILFLFDSQAGLTPLDEDLLKEMNRSGITQRIPLIAVVNKVDAECHEPLIADFFSLGLKTVLTISAEHGRGIDDLQTSIAEILPLEAELPEALEDSPTPESLEGNPEEGAAEFTPRTPKIAVVGRPNVGKSTLVNAILGHSRMITSPIAGTTVDSIDSLTTLNGKNFLFMDTAGIRRKSKTEQGIEVLSVVQTRKALERADIAVLLLDGEKGITDQDEKIGGLIEEVGCSVVLVVNKWDTQRRNRDFTPALAAERIRKQMAYLKYAPILFVSALRNEGIDQLGELFEEVFRQRQLKVATHEFTKWIREEATIHNPMNAKFFLCHQTSRNPPTFLCHVNDPDKIHFSLKRHLVNAMRARWGFMGSPVRLNFVEAKSRKTSPCK